MLKDLHGRLRPLGIADILDETVDLYRSNFVLLVGVSGVLNVPWAVLSALVERAEGAAGAIGAVFGFAGAVVVGSIVTGALTFAISHRYLGSPVSVGASYRRVLRSHIFFPLLGAMVLKDLIVFAPIGAVYVLLFAVAAAVSIQGAATGAAMAAIVALALLVPAAVWAFYFGIRFLLVEPAVILEQVGAGGALSRSWNLMSGNVSKGFWLAVVVYGVMLLIMLIVTGPTQLAIASKTMARQEVSRSLLAINTILTALIGTVIAPCVSTAWILLYYDMRIRKEGFDLELLARELDEKAREFRAQGAASLPQERPGPGHSPQDTDPNE